ncbi:sterol desaturase family protein [Xenorhabdus sp. XENO-10]|uniref:Sterol desaturase family protein n=1 Tax=Xenorhabdus yunnanensis TaxID=3025878 RepID=A0ABT5LHA8_9GAMM|nr:sterol desaturase family protein [Xenorhabdus yunnanensis]MDC9589968.1 sterol desaturase family protein [Xenorhabdus yunnanensis]
MFTDHITESTFYHKVIIPLWSRLTVFFSPNHGLFIGYLLIAFLIAVIFFSWKRKTWNPVKSGREVILMHNFTSQSSIDDLKLYFFDKIILGFIYSSILGATFFFRNQIMDLLASTGLPTQHYVPGVVISLLLTLGALVVFDFAVFFEHYLSHKILVLWEFHKIHHIAEHLTPLTAYRSHPVNQSCFILLVSVFTGIYSGIVGYFFAAKHAYIVFAGQNFFMFLLLMLGLNLQHSMVYLRYPKFIRNIFVSPAYHQLHHSSDIQHHDMNFGFIFSFWDKLFGTQMFPPAKADLAFGITGEKYENYSGLKNTYFTPFRRAVKRIKKIFGKHFSSPDSD